MKTELKVLSYPISASITVLSRLNSLCCRMISEDYTKKCSLHFLMSTNHMKVTEPKICQSFCQNFQAPHCAFVDHFNEKIHALSIFFHHNKKRHQLVICTKYALFFCLSLILHQVSYIVGHLSVKRCLSQYQLPFVKLVKLLSSLASSSSIFFILYCRQTRNITPSPSSLAFFFFFWIIFQWWDKEI